LIITTFLILFAKNIVLVLCKNIAKSFKDTKRKSCCRSK